MAKFSTIIATQDGFKAAPPSDRLVFKQLSASLKIDKDTELAAIMAEEGVLNADTNEPAKDFAEAQQLLIETFRFVSKMEDEQLLLAAEAQDPTYREFKAVLEAIRNRAEITVILRGEYVGEDKHVKRVTCYINPERHYDEKVRPDGSVQEAYTRKAGRFNTRILFENGIEVTGYGRVSTDAKKGIVINADGAGPHRDENDPINVAREARRLAAAGAAK